MPENIGSVTNYFTTAFENTIPMTLTSTILAGATTVAITGMTNYTNGEIVCFVVNAATPSLKQVFTGTVNTGAGTVTNVVWTEMPTGGSNVGHAAGATIIDYVTATAWDMAMTGILKFATQGGALQTSAVQAALNISNLAANGWNALGYTTTYGSNSGNKEFTVTATANLTTLLSPGMKFSVTRNTPPPTQCMSFTAASSQYASKTTPSGLSFTAAFTAEAWIYLNSYQTSATIISEFSGTTGWGLRLSASGQLDGFYGASSSYTDFNTYQSIPLNQWTHVAFAVTSVSAKTAAFYINGTLVPSTTNSTGATTLVQGGPLQVGALNSANFFDGYISEPRIWSVAQTQANIQANMAINLPATTNLAFGLTPATFTDLSGNGNTLTGSGGASATATGNPFNAIEYGVINTISYSNPTTTITLDTGTQCTIPNETLTNPEYSLIEAPYGVTAGLEQNRTLAAIGVPYSQGSITTAVLLAGLTTTVSVPPGRKVRLEIRVPETSSGPAGSACGFTLGIYNSTIVTGSPIQTNYTLMGVGGALGTQLAFDYEYTPTSGSQSYCVAITCDAGTGVTHPSAVQLTTLAVKLVS
jgi:hypothetical protein